MIEGCREHLFRGLMYYLNSILFARPVRRFIIRFIKRVLMRRPYEFNSQSLFVVYNRDVGALIVDVSRYYGYAWKYKGEEEVVKLLRCLLKVLRQGVFVDVGAYVGFYTVLAAKHGWRVVAFEPNPINLILLRYNIALHGVGDRVVIVDKVAGDAHGYARFSLSTSPSESSFTKYLRDELKLLNVDVEVVTIDSVLKSIGVKDVESLVIKVDVEGFGLRVLRGAAKTIERFRPFILFEVHRTFDDEDEIRALKMLKGLGYGFVVVEPGSRRNFIVYAYPMERGCLCYEQA
jgi:FkbM family methyltransferase